MYIYVHLKKTTDAPTIWLVPTTEKEKENKKQKLHQKPPSEAPTPQVHSPSLQTLGPKQTYRNSLPPACIQSLSLPNRSPVPRNIDWISGDRFLHEEQDLRILQQISPVVYCL